MTLNKNQVVVFEDGYKAGWLEARWSERHQAFWVLDDNGNKIYSTIIEEKPQRCHKKFTPTKENCTMQIFPETMTEKAYGVFAGDNGHMGIQSTKVYYKWYAKSICYIDENGNIFVPHWA